MAEILDRMFLGMRRIAGRKKVAQSENACYAKSSAPGLRSHFAAEPCCRSRSTPFVEPHALAPGRAEDKSDIQVNELLIANRQLCV